MAGSQPAAYVIEPFDPERHDRAAFSCGIEQVDNYFLKTANKLAKADNVRLYVMVDADGTVIGFYALNAHAVHFADLPAKFARTRPSHGSIPAAYISMIGRDQKFRGGGYGGDLLVDALRRITVAADAIGVAVVMLDVLDCGDPDRIARRTALYESYGFQALESNPLRMFLPVSVVLKLFAEGADAGIGGVHHHRGVGQGREYSTVIPDPRSPAHAASAGHSRNDTGWAPRAGDDSGEADGAVAAGVGQAAPRLRLTCALSPKPKFVGATGRGSEASEAHIDVSDH